MTYSLEGVVRIEATDTVFTGNSGKPRTSYGTGFLIDEQHVMTALHVLFPDFKTPASHSPKNWQANVFANVEGKIQKVGATLAAPMLADVVSNPLDVAVLRLDRALTLRPLQVSRHTTSTGARYDSFGYPGYSESGIEEGARKGPGGLPLAGTIGEVTSELFCCLVTPPPRPDSFRNWRSLSGAPVVCNGWVVGMLTLATEGWADVLHAVPTTSIASTAAFASLLPTPRSSEIREYVLEIARKDEVQRHLLSTAKSKSEWQNHADAIKGLIERLLQAPLDSSMGFLDHAHSALERGHAKQDRLEIGRLLYSLGSALLTENCPITYDFNGKGEIESIHSIRPWSFEVGVARATDQIVSFKAPGANPTALKGLDEMSPSGEMGPVLDSMWVLRTLGKHLGINEASLRGEIPKEILNEVLDEVLDEARALGRGELKRRRHPFFVMDPSQLSQLNFEELGDLRKAVAFVHAAMGSNRNLSASNAVKLLGDMLRRQDAWERPH